MSQPIDARPAAFVAAWGMAKDARDILAEPSVASATIAGLMLQTADVYARLANAPEAVGHAAAQRIVDQEIAAENTEAAADVFMECEGDPK